AGGATRGEVASQQAPVRGLTDADLTPAAERAWYRKWWVWAIAGVVAAGTTTAVILLERPGTDARLRAGRLQVVGRAGLPPHGPQALRHAAPPLLQLRPRVGAEPH